ncbi:hypothetical protein BC940DRAFT_292018 [Gongronella butleri]|nr:hypothetical protein BC940DRAFT_292018 [Gongronella butleri]
MDPYAVALDRQVSILGDCFLIYAHRVCPARPILAQTFRHRSRIACLGLRAKDNRC